MTIIADEIRSFTSRDLLHPLVRDNYASPRGTCNCSKLTALGRIWCTRDFGHDGPHLNEVDEWDEPWPPTISK